MTDQQQQKTQLVLAPGEYAYMQDTATQGQIKVHAGPTVINKPAQEVPVIYDAEEGRFRSCTHLSEAVEKSPIAVEGYYLVLFNPAHDGQQPAQGTGEKLSPELDIGRRVNIPGPCMFPLWPGQAARHIRGHHLRSNQYLIVRIYNEDEARKNWTKAVVKLAEGDIDDGETIVTGGVPEDLTVGKLYVIKGTEVSFYIPPTGVTVVQAKLDDESRSKDDPQGYVRNAETLEQLEYCILVDENGKKRYERGPQVVFPEPSEKFIAHKGSRKSRALELNPIQGIHVKVIAPYTEPGGTERKEGEELWITGKDIQIYFPREEHVLVQYDGQVKKFATAIPVGEGRYVMNRMTGEIKTVKGYDMLLPDPRTEVIVRRVLSDKQCDLWYPGNNVVAGYNRALRQTAQSAPSTRSGAVSEGDFERAVKSSRGARKRALASSEAMMMRSHHGDQGGAIQEDAFTRGSTYTQPRTITLNTKLSGVPAIDIWPGFAVMVCSKGGARRVEIGQDGGTNILLDYDESLLVLEMSTGKPKTTDNLLRTVYLKVKNNKVSDLVFGDTSDHVRVSMKLSYRVDFEGDPKKWFEVENYIKFFTDHARSVLNAALRKTEISEFYADPTEFIRTTVLGARSEDGRVGMFFEEIGLRVKDIEVLGVKIMDQRIQEILDQAQHAVVQGNIEIDQARHRLDLSGQRHDIEVAGAEMNATAKKRLEGLSREIIAAELATNVAKIEADVERYVKGGERIEANLSNTNLEHSSKLARERASAEQRITIQQAEAESKMTMIKAETQAVVDRFNAGQGGLSEALLALSSDDVMVKMAEATSVQRIIGGKDFVDAIRGILPGQSLEFLESKIAQLAERAGKPRNGRNRPKDQPTT